LGLRGFGLPRKKNSDDTTSVNEIERVEESVQEGEKPPKDATGTTKQDGIWLPTGSTLLDLVVGAGRGLGHEAGQLINIVSESQGGKTSVVNEAIANAHHMFGKKFQWIYDSTCEGGNTFDTQKLYKMDIIPKKGAVRSQTIQEAFCNISDFLDDLKDDEFGIYALDSIDAVVSDEIEDITEERRKAFKKGKDFDKGSYQGQKPKFLSGEFLPQIAAKAEQKNCLVIIISQLRDNVGGGMWAPKDRVSNGRALLFYCSSRIWLKTKSIIEKADRQIGVVVQADTRKARGPKPYRKCNYLFYYEFGIDDVGGNVDFLYDLRTEDKGELSATAEKSEIEWDGATFNRKTLIKHIEDNGLEKVLRERVIQRWNEIEELASKEISERKSRF
jgi:RecA/RadA recombinase